LGTGGQWQKSVSFNIDRPDALDKSGRPVAAPVTAWFEQKETKETKNYGWGSARGGRKP